MEQIKVKLEIVSVQLELVFSETCDRETCSYKINSVTITRTEKHSHYHKHTSLNPDDVRAIHDWLPRVEIVNFLLG